MNVEKETHKQPYLQKSNNTSFHPMLIVGGRIARISYLKPLVIISSLLLISIIGFSIVVKVDVVAIAPGVIVTSEKPMLVQSGVEGRIKKIYVRDGQEVKKGEPLVELDATTIRSQQQQLWVEINELKAKRGQCSLLVEAIRDDKARWAFSDPKKNIDNQGEVIITNEATELAADDLQLKLLTERYHEYEAAIINVENEMVENKAAGDVISANIKGLERIIPLIKEQFENKKKLMEKALIPKFDYLNISQELMSAQEELTTEKKRYDETKVRNKSLEIRREQIPSNYKKRWLTELIESKKTISLLEEDMVQNEYHIKLHKIVSPGDGAVHNLTKKTDAAFVYKGDHLMSIIPGDDEIKAEIWVSNKDIGFVEVGQNVRIKVDSFPYTTYGLMSGNVSVISKTSIMKEGGTLMYKATVILKENILVAGGKTYHLNPGMSVVAEIVIRKRRLFDYFTSPLLKHVKEGFKER